MLRFNIQVYIWPTNSIVSSSLFRSFFAVAERVTCSLFKSRNVGKGGPSFIKIFDIASVREPVTQWDRSEKILKTICDVQ